MMGSNALHRSARVHCKAARGQHGGTNKGLVMERIPKLLALATASVAVPQACRAQFEWMAARNAGPEPLTGRKARARLVVNPSTEEISDEKAS